MATKKAHDTGIVGNATLEEIRRRIDGASRNELADFMESIVLWMFFTDGDSEEAPPFDKDHWNMDKEINGADTVDYIVDQIPSNILVLVEDATVRD